MRYEHLIQINDPNNPMVELLTREQLWLGLIARAERPQYFLVGMDECRIFERTEHTLRRSMRFGAVEVRDLVTYEPMRQVRFDVEASLDRPDASLVMRIEEPQPGELFLRFAYALQAVVDDSVGDLDEYRKSAYRQADIDTVRMIRILAASGVLADEDSDGLKM